MLAVFVQQIPGVLVLDEATGSLDSESERAVVEGLRRFCEGRTSIIIAHRLATILYAEQLVLLDEGRVVQQLVSWDEASPRSAGTVCRPSLWSTHC